MTQKKREFATFGEYLYWSYANLQMLCYALGEDKKCYDRLCYMIRAKAFRAYKEGRWHVHDLLTNNVAKIMYNDFCWYCGAELPPDKLTKDHIFPRKKGGSDSIDNIMMVCKACNSSKGQTDLFEWYFRVRGEWPPIPILVHYLKSIYLYAKQHGLLEMTSVEIMALDLPFNPYYIPTDYPQPEVYMDE